MKDKFFVLILLGTLILGIMTGCDKKEDEIIMFSGYCGAEGDGSNLMWTLNDEGVLTISGTGAMKNYYRITSFNLAPWGEHVYLLKSLVIKKGVTHIGTNAFYGCGFTGSLTIPNSVKTIGGSAFSDCRGFTGGLTIPNSVETIGEHAFYCCSSFTGSLTIPNSVKIIGWYAFYSCRSFTGSLTIGNSVETIGRWAFAFCDGFTGSLTIGNSVKTIEEMAFYYCNGFTGDLTIPKSVVTIDGYAFYNCSGFTGRLTIPKSVNLGAYAFGGCSGFTSFYQATNAGETNIQ